jgi:hypothetical protein
VEFPAWIDIGNDVVPRSCTVVDVSDAGARITVAFPTKLPKEFDLILTMLGTKRRCQVVWCSDEQIGVSYVGPMEFWHLPTQKI